MPHSAESITVIEHEAEAGLGFFAGWLAEAGAGCRVVRPYRGEPVPADVTGGLVVLGGEASAWDDAGHPWLPATRALIRRAVERAVPAFGICLGAQLMTLALGGRVERGENGLEVGVRPVTPLPAAGADPVLGWAVPDGGDVDLVAVQYHRDAMTELPPGAVPLATGDLYPNQAYRLGPCAWAVQFHPEATVEIFTRWAGDSADSLTAAGFDVAELVAGVKAAEDRLAATWRPVAEAFAGIVIRAGEQ